MASLTDYVDKENPYETFTITDSTNPLYYFIFGVLNLNITKAEFTKIAQNENFTSPTTSEFFSLSPLFKIPPRIVTRNVNIYDSNEKKWVSTSLTSKIFSPDNDNIKIGFSSGGWNYYTTIGSSSRVFFGFEPNSNYQDIEILAAAKTSDGYYHLLVQGYKHNNRPISLLSGISLINEDLSYWQKWSQENYIVNNYSTEVTVTYAIRPTRLDFFEFNSLTYTTFNDFTDYFDELIGNSTKYDSDPYSPDGQSGTGGGDGSFDDTSDTVPVPDLPSLSAVDTGFVGIFKPSLSQLKALANYMWSDLFSVETFKKIFADPMDCILGLSIVPVAIPGSTAGDVKVGNISTGVSMTKASSQYVSVDCGTLSVNEFWGSFLDYAPHTKISIYLPFIGFHPLNTDEIMGATLGVIYHVDILTGALIAFITRNDSVIYTYEGACASNIPLSATDWTSTINGIINIATSTVSAVATGGSSAIAKAAGEMALSGAQNISSMKPTIEHSGSINGAGAIMAIQTPYLVAERPNQCLPANQNKYSGYPSFITAQIGNQSGFTQIADINPTGIDATDEELIEIISMLKEGVII